MRWWSRTPKAGNGRPPPGSGAHVASISFSIGSTRGPACGEALYNSTSLRRFVGIDPGAEPVPDATTMLRFRRPLNDNKLGEALFAKVGAVLQGPVVSGQDRNHRGRHDHRGAEFDQECRQGTRP